MKYSQHFFTLLFWAISLSASAEEPEIRASFDLLNRCVREQNPELCRGIITTDSTPIYNRFIDSGLMPCLPKDVSYVSQERNGNTILVHASTIANGNERAVRLNFTQENNGWKLNIPSSLQMGIGKDWEQKLNVTEQLYAIMRKQMGGQLNCSILQSMVVKK